jgi:hypothetical protein
MATKSTLTFGWLLTVPWQEGLYSIHLDRLMDKKGEYMEKLDLKKVFKHLYKAPSKEPVMVTVPRMNYLAINGQGVPDGTDAMQAIEALYAVAYTLKFAIKKGQGIDYPVMPLEGLWWTDDMSRFSMDDKSAWKWTYMIMQPEFITQKMIDNAIDEARRKKNPVALGKMKFEKFDGGLSAQIMHIGPYAEEGPTIKRLHDFIHGQGYIFDGLKQKHHEIYLSDPRKTAPDKMKTIIRQPVQ